MNKNFALLALLAYAEAIQLDCGPCGGCGCGCDEDDEPEPSLGHIDDEPTPIDDEPFLGHIDDEPVPIDDEPVLIEDDIVGGMQSAFMYEYEDCTGEKLELAITINPFDIVEYDVASL